MFRPARAECPVGAKVYASAREPAAPPGRPTAAGRALRARRAVGLDGEGPRHGFAPRRSRPLLVGDGPRMGGGGGGPPDSK